MACGWHYTKRSISGALLLSSFSGMMCFVLLFLSFCRLCLVFVLFCWSFVAVTLIFFLSSRHVPDCKPPITGYG